MTFEEAFERLIGHEGGFQKLYADAGNWTGGEVGRGLLRGTKYGISAAAYPNLDIENITLIRAQMIYRRDYWLTLGLDDMPEAIRFDLFDLAVNSGVATARRLLQEAVDVTQDGIIGPLTLSAVSRMSPELLDKRLAGARLKYICSLSPVLLAKFGRGWIRRIAENLLMD